MSTKSIASPRSHFRPFVKIDHYQSCQWERFGARTVLIGRYLGVDFWEHGIVTLSQQ